LRPGGPSPAAWPKYP